MSDKESILECLIGIFFNTFLNNLDLVSYFYESILFISLLLKLNIKPSLSYYGYIFKYKNKRGLMNRVN